MENAVKNERQDYTLVLTTSQKKTQKTAYNINTETELKSVMDYFKSNNKYLHYLLFIMGLNFGRRIGDTLNLRWNQFYTSTGEKRKYLYISEEQKTGKSKKMLINNAVWRAIDWYFEQLQYDPSKKAYTDYIALQLIGTHKGTVLTQEGFRLALKHAQKECNIEQNIATHTTRKTFGYFAKKLHPTDEFSTSVVSGLLNHSNERVTRDYIGITQEKEDTYVCDMGNMICDLMDNKKIAMPNQATDLVTIEYDDLRNIIQMLYQCGRENSVITDLQKHLDNIDSAMELIRENMK